jgi:uncharacterized membrane protein
MKTKFLKKFKAGFFTVLPFVLFFWIISWIFGIINGLVDKFLDLFSDEFLLGYDLLLLEIITIFIFLFLVFVFFIGYLVTHYYIGDKVKRLFKSFANRIPLFSMLFRISEQFGINMDKNKSLKKVVLVKFPNEWIWSLGFITTDQLDIFDNAVGEDLVAIFIPTTPNPTNGFFWFLWLKIQCWK